MKIVSRHILRNILENRLISLLMILSLTVTSANIYLNLTVKDELLQQYKAVLQGTYQNYNYYIYKSNPESEQDKYFEVKDLNVSGLPLKSVLGFTRASGVVTLQGKTSPVNLYGMDIKQLLDQRLVTLEQTSESLQPGAGKQIIISKRAADMYGIRLNDVLTVSTAAGKEKMTVAGISRSRGLFLNESSRIMMFASSSYIGSLNGMGDKVSGVYVEQDSSVPAESFEKKFTTQNAAYRSQALHDEDAIQSDLTTTNQLLIIVLLAVLVMVFYLNAGNMKIILAKRLPVMATMRSIGATRSAMSLILLAENLAYGLLGGIAGVLLGALLQKPALSALSSYGQAASALELHYSAHLGYAAAAVGLTAAFQAVVSAHGIIAASRRSLRESIADTASVKAGVSKAQSLIGLVLLVLAASLYASNTRYSLMLAGLTFALILAGMICLIPLLTAGIGAIFQVAAGERLGHPVKLGLHHLTASKTVRSSITLITVTLSIMLTVFLTTLSINQVFEHAGKAFGGDIELTGISEQAEAYSRLENVEGVQSIEPAYYKFDKYTVNGRQLNVGIFGMDDDSLGIRDESGKLGKLSAGEILIDRYYGARHGLKVGDKLKITGSRLPEINVNVAGYVNSSGFSSQRNVLVISRSAYLEGVSKVPSVIEVETDGDIRKAKESLVQALAGTSTSVQTVDEMLAANKSEVDSLLSLISLILGLSAGIAIIGVMVNQFIGFLQRKKEYAVLYSVGMSRSGLNRLIVTETAATFITGCLIAGMLGMLLSRALEQILYALGQYVSIGADPAAALKLLGGMFVLLMLTALLSLSRLPKLNIVREIKCE